MNKSLKIGAVSGLIAGIFSAITVIIVSWNAILILGIAKPPGGPEIWTIELLIIFSAVMFGLAEIWGTIWGVIYSKVYNVVPGKGIKKGIFYGMIFFLVASLRSSLYLFQ